MLENFVLKIYSASLSAQVTVSHKKMLNKSATHNQHTAFSSMTVWLKIRNTKTMYSHAETNSAQVTEFSLTEHSHAGKFCPQNLY
jgi:hypothetical protein